MEGSLGELAPGKTSLITLIMESSHQEQGSPWKQISGILMEHAKRMKLFILEKLLQDDSREKGV